MPAEAVNKHQADLVVPAIMQGEKVFTWISQRKSRSTAFFYSGFPNTMYTGPPKYLRLRRKPWKLGQRKNLLPGLDPLLEGKYRTLSLWEQNKLIRI